MKYKDLIYQVYDRRHIPNTCLPWSMCWVHCEAVVMRTSEIINLWINTKPEPTKQSTFNLSRVGSGIVWTNQVQIHVPKLRPCPRGLSIG